MASSLALSLTVGSSHLEDIEWVSAFLLNMDASRQPAEPNSPHFAHKLREQLKDDVSSADQVWLHALGRDG
jgi:hypothetical protein